MIYLYDGLFEGFLTSIYEHYYTQPATGIYAQAVYMGCLGEEAYMIKTDFEKAERVSRAISSKLTENSYHDVYMTFLSNEYHKDCYLLRYLIFAFKLGARIELLYSAPETLPIKRLSLRVSRERHRYIGILRFIEMGSCLYASMEPENDILATLAEHFADRLSSEDFIIHDLSRKKAVICRQGQWIVTDFELNHDVGIDNRERFFRDLWKTYFHAVGIDSRFNPALQQKFVPLKVRKHMTEWEKY
jgi:probable DNA metabolism protein